VPDYIFREDVDAAQWSAFCRYATARISPDGKHYFLRTDIETTS